MTPDTAPKNDPLVTRLAVIGAASLLIYLTWPFWLGLYRITAGSFYVVGSLIWAAGGGFS